MQNINISNIKINQIRIFLLSVETGSFSAAAEELHVTQPMVSKSIQNLEKELGIILFLRNKGRLQLTPAGKECYNQWANLLKHLESSISYAHGIQEGSRSRLRIATGSMSLRYRTFFQQLRDFRDQHAVDVYVECHPMDQLLKGLKEDLYDAALVSGHLLETIVGYGLQWKMIQKSYLAIFVPLENPLSRKKEISFKDLKKESFIAFSIDTDPSYLDLLNQLSAQAGFIPQIACYIPNEESFEVNLLLNNGIALIDSLVGISPNIAKKFDLKNLRNDYILVWNDSNTNKSLKDLLAYLNLQPVS